MFLCFWDPFQLSHYAWAGASRGSAEASLGTVQWCGLPTVRSDPPGSASLPFTVYHHSAATARAYFLLDQHVYYPAALGSTF